MLHFQADWQQLEYMDYMLGVTELTSMFLGYVEEAVWKEALV